MFDWFRNTFANRGRYRTNSRAVVISCFYNPQNSPYRLLAFQKWFQSVRHLNFRVIECLIGDSKKQLPDHPAISTVRTQSLLWHKETLLNKVVEELPDKYDYVFWVDADVLFTNLDWLVQGAEVLQTARLIQPFEWCIHLEKNHLEPNFDVDSYRKYADDPEQRHKMLWRSFCANMGLTARQKNYDIHGHVGFAWGAQRGVLMQCPLYDRALIGGADHILAHGAAGHLDHDCIAKSFTDNIEEVRAWMKKCYDVVQGRLSYVEGDLYHIWHGDIRDRQYLQRIRDFTPQTKEITQRDEEGLHVAPGSNEYMRRYYARREVTHIQEEGFEGFDAGFYEDMGYAIGDIINLFGPPQYVEPVQGQEPSPGASWPGPESVVQGDVVPTDPNALPTINDMVLPDRLPVPVESLSENFS